MQDTNDPHPVIPPHETLTVEFKSDRARLEDRQLIEALVCLANNEGGTIYVGVEDDGTVTGLHADHKDESTLAAMIANRTVPPVSVRASLVRAADKLVETSWSPRADVWWPSPRGLSCGGD